MRKKKQNKRSQIINDKCMHHRRSAREIVRAVTLPVIISIPLSACSALEWQKEHVSEETEICQLMSAEEMGRNLPSRINKYFFAHHDSHFYCSIILEKQQELETDFFRLAINYKKDR
jgi:hypothetical protein